MHCRGTVLTIVSAHHAMVSKDRQLKNWHHASFLRYVKDTLDSNLAATIIKQKTYIPFFICWFLLQAEAASVLFRSQRKSASKCT